MNKMQSGYYAIAFRRLKAHKPAIICLVILILLYLGAIFADFIAPYHYDDEDRTNSYANATKIHLIDKNKGIYFRPFIYKTRKEINEFHRVVYKEDRSQIYFLKLFPKVPMYKLWNIIPCSRRLFGVDKEARLYLWGADSRGRDLFSRIIYGSRISLSIGLIGVGISFILGLIIGGIAGYYGGKTDVIIMRICEMIMMIPGFYLMLALRSAFPPNLKSTEIYLLLIFIFSFIGWAGLARVIRGMTLSLKEREYVLAAQTIGISDFKIILRHILPHTLSYSIAAITLSIPGYILAEAGLSFIGLGIQDPQASWGNLLSEAMGIVQIEFYPWLIIPGFFIFITVICFNLLGEGLRDAFDPLMNMSKNE